MRRTTALMLAAWAVVLCGMRCSPPEPGYLDGLPTVRMTIEGQPFELWVADSFAQQSRGLKLVTADEMAPLPDGTERGMLFVFDHSVRDSFWMKDTIIPLDIAYVATDGTVVTIYTMRPMDDRLTAYPPSAPYRFAIEMNANRLSELGVTPGDTLDIPPSLLKGNS